VEQEKNPTMICLCEDYKIEEIEAAIDLGYTDFEELKRYLRVGMGPCQGRTCLPIIRNMLAKRLGKSIDEVDLPTNRPPASLVKFGTILECSEHNVEGDEKWLIQLI